MKRITVTLTEDQANHLAKLLQDNIGRLEYTVNEYSKPRDEIRNYTYWIAKDLDGTKKRLAFSQRILNDLLKAES